METVKKVFIFLIIFLALSAILVVIFKDQIKVVAVKKFVSGWTANLLEGAPLEEEELEEIKEDVSTFYALAVKEVIPEGRVRSLWDDNCTNAGFWYFYLKNMFPKQIDGSGFQDAAKEKAKATIDKFISYIKDGRARSSDLEELTEKMKMAENSSAPAGSMDDKELEKAVRKLSDLNEKLEKEGPGKPVDPVSEFRKIVDVIQKVNKKYMPSKDA